MPKNKDNHKSGSHGSMSGTTDREFEGQGKSASSGMGGQPGQKSSNTSIRGTGSDSKMLEDDEMNTAGGRKGNFSDKDRGSEEQWSPGSSGSSDQ